MRILITGGTGLIGRALCRHWRAQGHELWVWSRSPERVSQLCSGAHGVAQLEDLSGQGPIDAVVNLAGAPIADRPWTPARREVLWRSRIDLTRTLVAWMQQQPNPPKVLLSASAVGWYGNGAEAWLDEHSPPASQDFGHRLCMAWEEEALRATESGARVAVLRIAPVLAAQGGMLARLLPPFRMGLGGRLGKGQQWMPGFIWRIWSACLTFCCTAPTAAASSTPAHLRPCATPNSPRFWPTHCTGQPGCPCLPGFCV